AEAASVSSAVRSNRIHFDGDYVVAKASSSVTDSFVRMTQSAPALTMARVATAGGSKESATDSITNGFSDAGTVQRFFHVPQESSATKNETQLAGIQLVLRS